VDYLQYDLGLQTAHDFSNHTLISALVLANALQCKWPMMLGNKTSPSCEDISCYFVTRGFGAYFSPSLLKTRTRKPFETNIVELAILDALLLSMNSLRGIGYFSIACFSLRGLAVSMTRECSNHVWQESAKQLCASGHEQLRFGYQRVSSYEGFLDLSHHSLVCSSAGTQQCSGVAPRFGTHPRSLSSVLQLGG
jgi:hypothetical protein